MDGVTDWKATISSSDAELQRACLVQTLFAHDAVHALSRPGLRADFTVYSGSVLEGGEYMPRVLHTYLDGELVWSADKSV